MRSVHGLLSNAFLFCSDAAGWLIPPVCLFFSACGGRSLYWSPGQRPSGDRTLQSHCDTRETRVNAQIRDFPPDIRKRSACAGRVWRWFLWRVSGAKRTPLPENRQRCQVSDRRPQRGSRITRDDDGCRQDRPGREGRRRREPERSRGTCHGLRFRHRAERSATTERSCRPQR